MSGWLIEFDFEATVYAGWLADGTLGFAPTVGTAAVFATREAAERSLNNSYGPNASKCGRVVYKAMT